MNGRRRNCVALCDLLGSIDQSKQRQRSVKVRQSLNGHRALAATNFGARHGRQAPLAPQLLGDMGREPAGHVVLAATRPIRTFVDQPLAPAL